MFRWSGSIVPSSKPVLCGLCPSCEQMDQILQRKDIPAIVGNVRAFFAAQTTKILIEVKLYSFSRLKEINEKKILMLSIKRLINHISYYCVKCSECSVIGGEKLVLRKMSSNYDFEGRIAANPCLRVKECIWG